MKVVYPWAIAAALACLGAVSGCATSRGRGGQASDSLEQEYGPRGESGQNEESRDREDMPESRRPASTLGYHDQENLSPRVRRRYAGERRVTAENFSESPANEGSLWVMDGQDNYYFTKNRNRAIGDLITVVLEDNAVREALSEVKRTLTIPEKKMELALAQERIKAKTLGDPEPAIVPVTGSSYQAAKSDDANRAPAAAPTPAASPAAVNTAAYAAQQKEIEIIRREKLAKMQRATLADVDIVPYVGIKNGDQMLAEIVERFPNGNFKVRGTKKIPYRGGYRLVTLLGVVRGNDINEGNDTVLSGKLYEYRLNVLR